MINLPCLGGWHFSYEETKAILWTIAFEDPHMISIVTINGIMAVVKVLLTMYQASSLPACEQQRSIPEAELLLGGEKS